MRVLKKGLGVGSGVGGDRRRNIKKENRKYRIILSILAINKTVRHGIRRKQHRAL